MRCLVVTVATCGLTACLVRTPGIGASQSVTPKFEHAEFIGSNTCSACHESQRPAPIDDEIHGAGGECIRCHTPKDDRSGWLPLIPFKHTPKPSSCNECHAQQRPADPHPQKTDCVSCHNTTSFSTGAGTNLLPNFLVP